MINNAIQFFQGCLHDCGNPAFIELAIKALREKQEREKGCVCCGLIYKLDGASYGTDSVIIENRFCPMCGKRLEDKP